MRRIYRYAIDHPGELAAGIRPFSDTVIITVASGEPGGEVSGEDSFGEFIRDRLREWYDGASVHLIPD